MRKRFAFLLLVLLIVFTSSMLTAICFAGAETSAPAKENLVSNGDFEEELPPAGYGWDSWANGVFTANNEIAYTGDKSMNIDFGTKNYVDYRAASVLDLNTHYNFEFWLYSETGGSVTYQINAMMLKAPYSSLAQAEEITIPAKSWYQVKFDLTVYNENGAFYAIYNSPTQENIKIENPDVKSFECLQLRFTKKSLSLFQIDTMSVYRSFDGEISVTDEAGTPVENLEFIFENEQGEVLELKTQYNAEKGVYAVKDLTQTVKVTIVSDTEYDYSENRLSYETRRIIFGVPYEVNFSVKNKEGKELSNAYAMIGEKKFYLQDGVLTVKTLADGQVKIFSSGYKTQKFNVTRDQRDTTINVVMEENAPKMVSKYNLITSNDFEDMNEQMAPARVGQWGHYPTPVGTEMAFVTDYSYTGNGSMEVLFGGREAIYRMNANAINSKYYFEFYAYTESADAKVDVVYTLVGEKGGSYFNLKASVNSDKSLPAGVWKKFTAEIELKTVGDKLQLITDAVALTEGNLADYSNCLASDLNIQGTLGTTVYFDSFRFYQIYDQKVQIYDGDSLYTGEKAFEFEIKDFEGNIIEPEIEKADASTYIIKGLTSENSLKIVSSDIAFLYDEFKCSPQSGILDFYIEKTGAEFEINLTDLAGEKVTGATIKAWYLNGDPCGEVQEKGNGGYVIGNLKGNFYFSIEKEGYILYNSDFIKSFDAQNIVLIPQKNISSISGNLVNNGDFENDDLTFSSGYVYGTFIMLSSSAMRRDQFVHQGNYAARLSLAPGGKFLYRYDTSAISDSGWYCISTFLSGGDQDIPSATAVLRFSVKDLTTATWKSITLNLYNGSLSTDWTGVLGKFYFEKNAETKSIHVSTENGFDMTLDNVDLSSMAVDFDLTTGTKCIVYMDSMSTFRSFEGGISIVNEARVVQTDKDNVKIEIYDAITGAKIDNEIEYSAEDKVFYVGTLDRSALVKVTVGGKIYPVYTIDSRNAVLTVMPPYSIKINLVDEKGNFVSGAKITAYSGNEIVGTLQESDSSYILNNIIGTVILEIEAENYIFERTYIGNSNNECTIYGYKEYVSREDNEGESQNPEKESSCKSSLSTTGSVVGGIFTMLITLTCVCFIARRGDKHEKV